MERDLNERDKAGVPDAVLLEDFTNENVFIENLEKRFNENIIYVRKLSGVVWCHQTLFCYRVAHAKRAKVKVDSQVSPFQTYIGQVLISLNPYKELPIYSEEDVQAYRDKYFFENPPHV